MDLDDPARYAIGALFCLALHSDETRAGAQASHHGHSCWGQHERPVLVTSEEDSEEFQGDNASLWDLFWGYDLVKRRGLLERTYKGLKIPESSWAGLRVLPEVAAQAGYPVLVQQYRGILENSLRSLSPPEVVSLPPLNEPDTGKQDTAGLTAAVEEDDEDLAGDLHRARFATSGTASRPVNTGQQESSGQAESQPDLTSIGHPGKASKGEEEVQLVEASVGKQEDLHQRQAGASLDDDTKPASELAAHSQKQAEPAAVAFQAATELLEACVASLDQPTLEDVVKADKEKGKAAKVKNPPEERGAEKAVNVRWYDSRAREALQVVAHWLHVPWPKMLLYECLLAQQSQAPEMRGSGQKKLSPQERRMRALKIGAAAAGGGALLAITGGLAAPALAAVAGTMMTTVGGSAAAAGAVTGIMGSTVGAAAVIAGFGAGGAHVVGGKMARRIGDVKEFGFREVPEDGDYVSSYSANVPTADATTDPGKAEQEEESKPAPPTQEPRDQLLEKNQEKDSSWLSSTGSWIPWRKKEEVEAVPLLPIPVLAKPRPDPKLSRTIVVAGCVAEPDDFVNLWRGVTSVGAERFTLVWETKELIALNKTIMDMLLSQAYTEAGKYIIEKFVVHGLVGAVALPLTIMNASGLIDSSWAIVMNRAARAGELLAHLLMSGAHGDCPVSLIGNSMGARCKCKGVIQNAVMLGTPADILPERWTMARSVVAGRCVNGYSKKDWVLALSFRARQGTFRPAAGLGAVAVPGIENFDLTDIVHGHGDYIKRMDEVLSAIDLKQPDDAP